VVDEIVFFCFGFVCVRVCESLRLGSVCQIMTRGQGNLETLYIPVFVSMSISMFASASASVSVSLRLHLCLCLCLCLRLSLFVSVSVSVSVTL